MNKVYLIFRDVDYEGTDLVGVYSNRRAAADHLSKLNADNRQSDVHYSLQEHVPKREYHPEGNT